MGVIRYMVVRKVETSIHGPGFHICGIQPKPSEERVALNRDYHPGFGYVSLRKDGQEVWGTGRPEESRTLGWVERTKIDDDSAEWTFDVDGPMVSYTLIRRKSKYWVLLSSRDGFA
jgi:hypothetical protein